jgi:hypothetical protein
MFLHFVTIGISGLIMVASMAAYGQESYPLKIQLSGPAGIYDVQRWKHDWPGCKFEDGIKEGHASLIGSPNMKWLRVTCQANEIGPEKGGIGWRMPIPSRNRLELAYRVMFSDDFDFVKGGKLPGLCGGPESVTGGNPANGVNGFSARFMWRADGRGEAYLYHVDQPTKFGESIPFPDDFRFPRGKPFMLIMRVDMNEIGEADGTFEAWVKQGDEDALKVVHRDNLRWRTAESVQIDSLLCEVFHGGGDSTWAPKKSCTVDLSDFQLLE